MNDASERVGPNLHASKAGAGQAPLPATPRMEVRFVR